VLQTHRTKRKQRNESCNHESLERDVRELLARKISGTLAGLWLLIPEYLRLGSWDLLRSFRRGGPHDLNARLCLQLVNESALCLSTRQSRSLNQRGMEAANGLPFLAADAAIHDLLDPVTIGESGALQVSLGKIRRSLGHFDFDTLSIDPHRLISFSQRQMVHRQKDPRSKASKHLQSFFCFSAKTRQPICMSIGSSSRTLAGATKHLLELAGEIMPSGFEQKPPLVLADAEHYLAELMQWSRRRGFKMLVPAPNTSRIRKSIKAIAPQRFHRHWAGYATAKSEYRFSRGTETYTLLVQRKGEGEDCFDYSAFLCSSQLDDSQALEALSEEYPLRWDSEEFFRHYEDMGWGKAGTMNQNIRYAQMSLALIAQAAVDMLRKKLPEPFRQWNARHLAENFFMAMDGDIRVKGDTILVTYYNAPNRDLLENEFSRMPEQLEAQNIDPRIPWLFGFKLDFRFL